MAGTDPWNGTDRLDEATLDVMVARLEARGENAEFVGMLDDYLDAMEIDAAATVLDLGCGTGLVSRRICARPDFDGTCHGIDLSDYLVSAARRLADAEGAGERVRFEAGDTHSLNLADASYDAVIAHTLFSHLDDPGAVLGEMARVVRPGGRIAVYDGDYASLTFEEADPEQSRQNSERVIEALVTQPRVLRRMPRIARRHGLVLDGMFSYVLTEAGRADFWVSAVEGFRVLGPRSGVVTEAEANAWADAQLAASEEGVFFGSSNYYTYLFRPA